MDATIFVSIASFMDPLLLRTIASAVDSASRPDRIHFGIVDQSRRTQREAVDRITSNAAYMHVHPRDSLGACWARSTAQTMMRGQRFFLQVDAHTHFAQGWDNDILAEFSAIASKEGHERFVLTAYPPHFELDPYGEPVFRELPKASRTMRLRTPEIDPLAGIFPATQMVRIDATGPTRGVLIAAGFLFAPAQFCEEIPYDPLLYFNGEELALAVRAFTRGWDVWHPEHIPAFHRYASPSRPLGAVSHASSAWQNERRWNHAHLIARHQRRFRALIDDKVPGPFGLGDVRPLENFWEKAGGRCA